MPQAKRATNATKQSNVTIARETRHPKAYEFFLRGRLALARGRPERALTYFGRAVAHDTSSPSLWTQKGVAQRQLGRMEEAEKSFRHAVMLHSCHGDAWLSLAALLDHRNRSKQAESAFERAMACGQNQASVLVQYTDFLARHGRFVRAKQYLTDRMKHDGDPKLRIQLARICSALFDLGCAGRQYAKIAAHWQSPGGQLEIARWAIAAGNLKKSAQAASAAYALSGQNDRIIPLLFHILKKARLTHYVERILRSIEQQYVDRDIGVESYLSALLAAERPRRVLSFIHEHGDATALDHLKAMAEFRLGMRHRAKRRLEAIAQSDSVETLVSAAKAYSRIQSPKDAVTTLERALSKARQSAKRRLQVVVPLTQTLTMSGHCSAALEHAKRELQAGLGSNGLRYNYAMALQACGKWHQAVDVIKSILEKQPRNAMALNFLGYVHVQHDRLGPDSERWIRMAMYHEPWDANVIDSLGWLYHRRGWCSQARRTLAIAHRMHEEDAEIAEHVRQVAEECHRKLDGKMQAAYTTSSGR